MKHQRRSVSTDVCLLPRLRRAVVGSATNQVLQWRLSRGDEWLRLEWPRSLYTEIIGRSGNKHIIATLKGVELIVLKLNRHFHQTNLVTCTLTSPLISWFQVFQRHSTSCWHIRNLRKWLKGSKDPLDHFSTRCPKSNGWFSFEPKVQNRSSLASPFDILRLLDSELQERPNDVHPGFYCYLHSSTNNPQRLPRTTRTCGCC